MEKARHYREGQKLYSLKPFSQNLSISTSIFFSDLAPPSISSHLLQCVSDLEMIVIPITLSHIPYTTEILLALPQEATGSLRMNQTPATLT